jgi:hypothetical protein
MTNTTTITDADASRICAAQSAAYADGAAAAKAGRKLTDNPYLSDQDSLRADGSLTSDDDAVIAWHLGWEEA